MAYFLHTPTFILMTSREIKMTLYLYIPSSMGNGKTVRALFFYPLHYAKSSLLLFKSSAS